MRSTTAATVTSSVISLFFMMVILSCGEAQEILKIWREPSFQNDDITVADSQCTKSQAQCDRYNAKHLTQCFCFCVEKLGFWEPTLSCVPYNFIRQESGCQLLFSDERADQRLKFFSNRTTLEKDVRVPPNQSCTFYNEDQFFVQYLDCTGSWRSLTTPNVLSTIELSPGWSQTFLKIRIKAGSTLFANLTAGRLIRVPIQCRRINLTVEFISSCIVFMGEGDVECPYFKPTVHVPHTSATQWLNWTSSTPAWMTTEENRELETSAIPITMGIETRNMHVLISPCGFVSLIKFEYCTTTSTTESSTSKAKRDAGTNGVVISIAVGCAVVFAIFLSFLVLLCKRRKSKDSQQETKPADRNPVVEIQIGRLMEHVSTSVEQVSQSTNQELISNSGQGGIGHNTVDDNPGNCHLHQRLDNNIPVTAAQAYQNVWTPVEAPDYQNVKTRVAATDYQNVWTPVTAPDYQNVQTPVTAPDYQNVQTLQGGLPYASVDTLGGQTDSAYEPLKGCLGQNVYESLTKEATELH